MTTLNLRTPRECDVLIARLFRVSRKCIISVADEKAFREGNQLSLGEVELFGRGDGQDEVLAAVRRGAFEWTVPNVAEAEPRLAESLAHSQLKNDAEKSAAAEKLRRVLDGIATIAVRAGLLHPIFDPDAIEMMPFRRSTTVVADTSGAVQGALDFVSRYLHPAARVKVPAIVQMEIVNLAERFLRNRRSAKIRRTDLLLDHLMSQGGQRVLLRLELQADTEVERTFLLGDPLRNAFQKDSELSDLNLSTPVRAYADRLVLEAARHHQAQANLGHTVQLLTSDQGLARMALAEGLRPLYFRSVRAGDFFGKRLTGAILHPFTGEVRGIGVTSVMWELATAFGCARLKAAEDDCEVTVTAIGDGLSWSPYHSHADLLWTRAAAVPDWPSAALVSSVAPASSRVGQERAAKIQPRRPERTADQPPSKRPYSGAIAPQRFNVGKLFLLLDALDNEQVLPESRIAKVVGAKGREGVADYRRFLLSADAIEVDGDNWRAKQLARELAVALRNEDIPGLRNGLKCAPSFADFARLIEQQPIGKALDLTRLRRAERTYVALAEVTEFGASIYGEGLYPTPSRPDPAGFARIAIDRFRELDRGEGLVATGAWLEALVRQDGIHPEVARMQLEAASSMGLLRRSTEGSTTEVRFDRHVIQALRVQNGIPNLQDIHLYRGDYLIPGKSSTSLRIEGSAS
jgi:hypothetical protein